MTEAANTLAVFLRELTDGLSLRELAERYEGGKTLWGEYRSGAQIVPLSRLNTVVKDRVRDARGREVMLAKARQLHGHAMTAQSEAQPDLAVGEALRQAEQDIADMTRLIKVLVARIDALQDEAAKQTTDDGAEGTGLAEGSVTTIAAQLEVLRRHVEEARRVRDATRDAYDAAQSEAPAEQTGQDSASGQEPAAVQTQSGTELVGSLAQLHDTAARQREMLRLWDGDEGGTDAASGRGGGLHGGGAPDGDAGQGQEGDAGAKAGPVHGRSSHSAGYDTGRPEQEAPRSGPAGAPAAVRVADTGVEASAAAKADHDDSGPPQGCRDGGRAGPGGAKEPQPGAEEGPEESDAEPVRQRVLRLPAGASLALLIAACVIGGMLIARYTAPPAEARGPETRLDAPTAPPSGSDITPSGLNDPQSPEPAASATPTPSEPAPSEPAPSESAVKPSAEPAPTKSKAPQAAPPPPVVGTGPRTWVSAGTQMCLEIRRSSGDDGATANQWTCNNSSSQKWIIANPTGVTTVVSMDSGKCLEIRRDSVEDGATANQWTCNNSPTQSWRFQPVAGGGWSLVNANSGKCLTIRDQGDGALASQWPCDNSPAQTWH
ncbi:RICIN domain-containing protein [Streptomyces sp. NBC_00029]|uniref:RICIN domain-containing protein n=1 Tax=Streptomyces sp. NBC_00029 TaxID=2903613 RepID=UPI003244EA6A